MKQSCPVVRAITLKPEVGSTWFQNQKWSPLTDAQKSCWPLFNSDVRCEDISITTCLINITWTCSAPIFTSNACNLHHAAFQHMPTPYVWQQLQTKTNGQQSPPLELLSTPTDLEKKRKLIWLPLSSNLLSPLFWSSLKNQIHSAKHTYISPPLTTITKGDVREWKVLQQYARTPPVSNPPYLFGEEITPNFIRRYLKTSFERGFVKISAACFVVGTYSNFTSPSVTLSFRKWYLMAICLVLLCELDSLRC